MLIIKIFLQIAIGQFVTIFIFAILIVLNLYYIVGEMNLSFFKPSHQLLVELVFELFS
jgi:hypothetical protein